MYSINFCRICLAESDSKKSDHSQILKDEELKSKFEAVAGFQVSVFIDTLLIFCGTDGIDGWRMFKDEIIDFTYVF